ncbi:hypothetical protein CJP74_01475 [Psittacicella melopsittaci]|uniref:Uncharacterized protein n=1 Tax=Psittacicella melopsittaci TaxID=2028576 RepID=A0A3A1Y5M0_9GAMM|nr:hypothetical protein [Psittacicella melopsittaci]RIY33562.1 hypothetical protein CJP74_01475 [Psittacicella melopsittaci]
MTTKHLFLLPSATAANLAALVIKEKNLNLDQVYVLYTAQAYNAVYSLGLEPSHTLAIDKEVAQFSSLLNDFNIAVYFALGQSYYQLIANFLGQTEVSYANINAQSLTLPEFEVYIPYLDSIEAQFLADHPQCSSLNILEADVSSYLGDKVPLGASLTSQFAEFYQDYPEATYYHTGIPPYIVCRSTDLKVLFNAQIGTKVNPVHFYRTNLAPFYWVGQPEYQGRATQITTFTYEQVAQLPQSRELFQSLMQFNQEMRADKIVRPNELKANLWLIDALTLQLLTPEHYADYLVKVAEKFSYLPFKKVLVHVDARASQTQVEQISLALQTYGVEGVFLQTPEFYFPLFASLPPHSLIVHGLFAPELCYAVVGRQNFVCDLVLALNYPEVLEFCQQAGVNYQNLIFSLQNSLGIDFKDADFAYKSAQIGRERLDKYLWGQLVDQSFVDFEQEIQNLVLQLKEQDQEIVIPSLFDLSKKDALDLALLSQALLAQESKDKDSESEEATQPQVDLALATVNPIYLDANERQVNAKALKLVKERAVEGSASDLNVLAQARSMVGMAKRKQQAYDTLVRRQKLKPSVESEYSVAHVVAQARLEQEQQEQEQVSQNPFAYPVNEHANKIAFNLAFLQKFISYQQGVVDSWQTLTQVQAPEQTDLAIVPGFSPLGQDKTQAHNTYSLLDFIYTRLDIAAHQPSQIAVVTNQKAFNKLQVWFSHLGHNNNDFLILTTKPELFIVDQYFAGRYIDIRNYISELEAKPYFNIYDVVNVGYKLQARIQSQLGFGVSNLYVPQFNNSLLFTLIMNSQLITLNVLAHDGVNLEFADLGLGSLHQLIKQYRTKFGYSLPSNRLVEQVHGIDNIVFDVKDDPEEINRYNSYRIRGTRYRLA